MQGHDCIHWEAFETLVTFFPFSSMGPGPVTVQERRAICSQLSRLAKTVSQGPVAFFAGRAVEIC